MSRKYRVVEEKYDDVSHFYPQYIEDDGTPGSYDYQYFGSFELPDPILATMEFPYNCQQTWVKEKYLDINGAHRRIRQDIKNEIGPIKETIIHEYVEVTSKKGKKGK